MDKSNTDISVGAEGRTSMEVMSKGMDILADNPTALKNSRTAMETVGGGTGNSGLAEGLGLILAGNFTL